MQAGSPWILTSASSSRATLDPEMLVSATSARFSRQQSSFTARIRKRRQAPKVSDRKSSDQRWFGLNGTGIGDAAAARPFAATTATDGQPFLAVNPVELLFIHHHALALQHDTDAPIAEPTPLLGDLVHFLTDLRVVGRTLSPHGLRIDTDQDAGPAL